MVWFRQLAFVAFLILLSGSTLYGQYFGRNQPVYRTFDFRVAESPHLSLYHYFASDSTAWEITQWGERWHAHHQRLFLDTLPTRNPLIIYQHAGDFLQTTAVLGQIGVGTGGVTEALKNRVVLPISSTPQQTDHVLGHELVHAFQYNLILNGDSTNINHLQNIPLWMIEGMAEYFSRGAEDTQTAMWMRDAVHHDFFPSFREMTRDMAKYFPYRYGQAFWAWFGQRFGDEKIVPFLRHTALHGFDKASERILGYTPDSLCDHWLSDAKLYYTPLINQARDTSSVGTRLIFEQNAGETNISPSISPDGRWIAFFSEKNLFSIDLFLADAESGRIVKTLSSTVHETEVDALSFVESAGGWSADSRYFAFVGFRKGGNVLLVADIERRKLTHEISHRELPSFSNPTWTPSGDCIVVSGLREGISQLYELPLDGSPPRQLTDAPYSHIQPCYHPDGKHILFVTDALAGKMPFARGYSLAELDLTTGTVQHFNVFPGAENVNPVYAKQDERIYFLSNADGYRNLYSMVPTTREVYRLTSFITGIGGMTPLAPAMSVARDNGMVVYSLFEEGKYSIFRALPTQFHAQSVSPNETSYHASRLAPGHYDSIQLVNPHPTAEATNTLIPQDSIRETPYRHKFRLDVISNAGVGVGMGAFGMGMGGGAEFLCSDIMGRHLLLFGISLNGEIWDFGGQVQYVNRQRPIQWAFALSHLPYSTGYFSKSSSTHIDSDDSEIRYDTIRMHHLRHYESKAEFMVQYPLSQTVRLESGLSGARYSYRLEVQTHSYENDEYTNFRKEKLPAPSGFWLTNVYLAGVMDNSFFGIASPMRGGRYRLHGERVMGKLHYWGTLIDLRKYWYVKPVSFAFRTYFNARWGINSDTRYIYPLYIGYPWLIRGYDQGALFRRQTPEAENLTIEQLTGSRMAILNAEIRLPLTGPKRLGVISSRYLFTELALFADAGLVWYNWDRVRLQWHADESAHNTPLASVGLSLRINLFGLLVLEPYYAVPFQLGGWQESHFGLNFAPGW